MGLIYLGLLFRKDGVVNTKVVCHNHSLKDELVCHFPYAIFSVSLSLIILSFMTYGSNVYNPSSSHSMFHSLHFLHFIFAGTGAVLTFRRYSKNIFMGILVGCFVPATFCTTSDTILPYLGGLLLNVNMRFHWCFIAHIWNVLPFLFAGVLNGFVLSNHFKGKEIFYSNGSHFFHIFVSSMASVFYLVSFGFTNWAEHMGFVFIFLLFAVLVPCTVSDVIVPTLIAKFTQRQFGQFPLSSSGQCFDSLSENGHDSKGLSFCVGERRGNEKN